MTPPIAILGAGPSGIALGRLLEVANIDYIVFERDESEKWAIGQVPGGTLDIHSDIGQVAIRAAGLIDEFRKVARYEGVTTVIADWTGKIFASLDQNGEDTSRPEIDRKDLRRLLLGSIPPDRIRWSSPFTGVQKEADGTMSVRLADGSVESGFRLVVGADGAWSKVRKLLTPAVPEYSGVTYFSTTIRPGDPAHSIAASYAGRGTYMAFGDEKQIAPQLLGDGSYYLSVGLRLREHWPAENAAILQDPLAIRRMLIQEHFAKWPEALRGMIEHSEGPFRAYPLYAMPIASLSWESVPGVTLIGDAAHLTTPFEGEGVNSSLFDSFKLAEQIVQHGVEHLDRAIAQYEREMFPRGISLISRSEANMHRLYAADSPRQFLQAAGVELVDRGSGWISRQLVSI